MLVPAKTDTYMTVSHRCCSELINRHFLCGLSQSYPIESNEPFFSPPLLFLSPLSPPFLHPHIFVFSPLFFSAFSLSTGMEAAAAPPTRCCGSGCCCSPSLAWRWLVLLPPSPSPQRGDGSCYCSPFPAVLLPPFPDMEPTVVLTGMATI